MGRVKKASAIKPQKDAFKANEVEPKVKEGKGGYWGQVPYGQQGVLPASDTEIERVATFWKDSDWPAHIMSFEVWCAMTMYEPGTPSKDGGEKFQKLMLQLLSFPNDKGNRGKSLAPTTNSTRYGEKGQFKDLWDSMETGHYWNPHLTGDDRYGAVLQADVTDNDFKYALLGDYSAITMDGGEEGYDYNNQFLPAGKLIPTGPHMGSLARPNVCPYKKSQTDTWKAAWISYPEAIPMGLPMANYSNPNQSDSTNDFRDYKVEQSYAVFGKHDWLVKAGLQYGNFGSGQSSQAGQYWCTLGHDTKDPKSSLSSTCWEIGVPHKLPETHKCVAPANALAAIYGLYYYKGCDDERYQWKKYHKVNGMTFEIRMRCPNPAYGRPEWFKRNGSSPLHNSKLYVHEPLNSFNKAYLTKFMQAAGQLHPKVPNSGIKIPPDGGSSQAVLEDFQYVGHVIKGLPDHGFEVPIFTRFGPNSIPKDVSEPQQGKPASPWMHISNANLKMQVVPFLNVDSKKVYELSTSGKVAMQRGSELHAHLGPGENVVSKLQGNVCFGFRMAQAALLYPHMTMLGDTVYDDLPVGVSAISPSYMTEPKLHVDSYKKFSSDNSTSRLATPRVDKAPGRIYAGQADAGLAYAVLNFQEWENLDADAWRLKLLSQNTSGGAGPSGTAPTNQPPLAANPTNVTPVVLTTEAADADVDDDEDLNRDTENQGPMLPAPNVAGASGTESGQQELEQRMNEENRNVVETETVPGANEINTLHQCNPDLEKYDYTQKDLIKVRKLQNAPRNDERLRTLYKALDECDMMQKPLEPGSVRKNLREKQCHFTSSLHQPWSFHDTYTKPEIEYEFELKQGQTLSDYVQKYGHSANLYLSGDNGPKQITNVEIRFGEPKEDVWSRKLTEKNHLFRLNLAKILALYYSPEGIGHVHGETFTFNQKQAGMLHGLWRCKVVRSSTAAYQKVQTGKMPRGQEQLWGAVFHGAEPRLSNKFKDCIKEYVCNQNVVNSEELLKCLKNASSHPGDDDAWMDLMDNVKSEMTVEEWVTTPWHLETLPYQEQYAIFRDGECYSEGCKRCCRRFYEYPYMVYADKVNGMEGTFGYAYDLFKVPSDNHAAPRPLHDPIFFAPRDGTWANANQLGRVPESRDTDRDPRLAANRQEQQSRTGNRTMDWPVYVTNRANFDKHDQKRKAIQNNDDLHFRRYINLAYADGLAVTSPGNQATDEPTLQTYYKGVCQGYMFGTRSKVRFGMHDYRLTRSHKYGNVCRDCAIVLDTAPGLFVRNNRFQFDSGGLMGSIDKTVQNSSYDYWTSMVNTMRDPNQTPNQGQVNSFITTFDDLILKGRVPKCPGPRCPQGLSNFGMGAKRAAQLKMTRDEVRQRFEQAADNLSKAISAKQQFPSDWTKLVSAPSINVQGGWSKDQQAMDDITAAIKMLNDALDSKDPTKIDLNNNAIRNIIREVERKYMHNEAFVQIDHTYQFDTDIRRVEHRNCMIEWLQPTDLQNEARFKWLNHPSGTALQIPDGGKSLGKLTVQRYSRKAWDKSTTRIYLNCLITEQYQPPIEPNKDPKLYLSARQPQHTVMQVFLATATGPQGQVARPVPTQWSGDRYVTTWVNDEKKWLPIDSPDPKAGIEFKHVRKKRQSRLFITYSLHRPITSENQGRQILERMADALYEIFGNDRWLSQLLVFGKKIETTAGGDSISRGKFETITKPKKQSALKDFYAGNAGSSYVFDTYETHVDKVEVDGGCEIGPKMGFPHFHLLLTIDHFSYVQFDYIKMNTFLEIMFKGIPTYHAFGGSPEKHKDFMLGTPDDPFYGDNENPYVDLKLYPEDNFKEVLAAYVRKTSGGSDLMRTAASRALPGTAEERRAAAAAAAQQGAAQNPAANRGPLGVGTGGAGPP